MRHPLRRVKHQPFDPAGIFRRVSGHQGAAPGLADQAQFLDFSPRQNGFDRDRNVVEPCSTADRWWIGGRIGQHFPRAAGFAVAAQVDQINVKAPSRDVVHPRNASELQVEGRFGRIGPTMDEQDRAIGTEGFQVGRPLVANIDP